MRKIKAVSEPYLPSGITEGKLYSVISIENCAGDLFKIKDDTGETHRYSPEFFENGWYWLKDCLKSQSLNKKLNKIKKDG